LPVEANSAWLLRLFGQPWIYGSLLGYIGSFFTWVSLLKHAPIGPAVAASHLEVVSVMLLSVWLFGEHLTVARVLGAVAIVAVSSASAFAESHEHALDTDPARA
jgi:drug/metabolite transporter (DMT)-like permease